MSQTLGSSQGTLEERFSYLLQPIRDLAKNWDIDIAHFLEEYLDNLEKIEITFDDGATTMNFSEAAMLIQGSAGVYAKKVEYLYSLVFQVLDLVTQKKKSKDGAEEGANNDNEHPETDEQFLPLDDIPEGEGTYTKELDTTSNKSVKAVPEMPTRLIPLEESEKGDNTLYNKKGEVMGNHCDFNIDTGYISTDGSLLLEMGDKMLLGLASRQLQMLHEIAEESMGRDGVEDLEVPPLVVDDVEDNGVEGLAAGEVCDGEVVAEQPAVQDGNGVQTKRSLRKRVTFVRPEQKKKPESDPWAVLDPHEKGKAVEKPLKKKKPFKIPAELEKNKKRKKVKIKVELPPIDQVVDQLFSHRSKFPKDPFKVPDYPELEEAFWEEFKRREDIKKEQIKQLKKEEKEKVEIVEEEVEEAEEDLGDDVIPGDADDVDDDIPQLQFDDHLLSDHHEDRWTGLPLAGISRFGNENDITLSYEDLVMKHVEKFLASAAEYAQITELSRRVAEWEEKIKPKLEEQDMHEAFDIHKYGTSVIDQLVRGERKAFREIVGGKPEFEICRITLATLQLANVYNVELTVIPDATGNVMDCLYVTLLSTKRHFEDLDDYRAPSLKES